MGVGIPYEKQNLPTPRIREHILIISEFFSLKMKVNYSNIYNLIVYTFFAKSLYLCLSQISHGLVAAFL